MVDQTDSHHDVDLASPSTTIPVLHTSDRAIVDNDDELWDETPMEAINSATEECSEEIVEQSGAKGLNKANSSYLEEETVIPLPRNILEKGAVSMANNPCRWFGGAWILTLMFSVLGILVGEFAVEVDNTGWTSRGTLIANRETQALLVKENRLGLWEPNSESLWNDLINNVQEGWESEDDDFLQTETEIEPERRSRREAVVVHDTGHGTVQWDRTRRTGTKYDIAGVLDPAHRRSQQTNGNETLFGLDLPEWDGCETSWYTTNLLTDYNHLWPIWRTNTKDISALDGRVIRDICLAEQNTQTVLKDNKLCHTCDSGECLPPYSLVFFARLTIGDFAFSLSCDDLASEWESNFRADMETKIEACVADIKRNYDPDEALPESCPLGFNPILLDEQFGTTDPVVQYTSSVFMTTLDLDGLWDNVDKFDRAYESDVVTGVYDTQYEDFVGYTADDALIMDMSLALGSALVTGVAILVHTRSPWLTIIGLCQIILSFPLAFFVYSLIARLEFFPFLNFIGVFVVFALGADDIFVAVDKWKNARLEHRHATTAEIATVALPDAALSMLLTSVTTAVAFFGTAICPVAPLKMFAVFNGLLISFDYILCVFLIFPALCLYDKWILQRHNCCVSCHCCHRFESHGKDTLDGDIREEKSDSFIRRLLTRFYDGIHYTRWVLVLICVGAMIVCGIYAASLELPDSSDVRILDESNEHEKCYEWRQNLLSSILVKQSGSQAYIVFGLTPADTGDKNNPTEWSQLVLDEGFDPSSEAAQEYLLGYCPDFFGTDFAAIVEDTYECSMNKFHSWLQRESSLDSPSIIYNENCNGATGVPMSPDDFDACILAWSYNERDSWVLARNGMVQVILFPYQSRVRYDSPYQVLDDEWHLIENWMNEKSRQAPLGVRNAYSSSGDFWWYDTNGSILSTAYGAAGIALVAAAIVMLISSRSFEVTFFALFTIGFILLSVTTLLVASGWTLGFLESVCFAILIGVSCDFVIHFGHAYSSLPGDRSRHERSKYAVIRMGPSILAGAFTTICAAVVMLFTVITFFQKFAQILFYTVVMASAGSFIVFISLSDTFGPSQPTVLVDSIMAKIHSTCCTKSISTEDDENNAEISDETKDLPPKDERMDEMTPSERMYL